MTNAAKTVGNGNKVIALFIFEVGKSIASRKPMGKLKDKRLLLWILFAQTSSS